MKTFAEKVSLKRKQLGLSQTQLAERVGVSLRMITAYENGVKKPRPSTLLKLSEALGVSTQYLTEIDYEEPEETTELDKLLKANTALFAGGNVSQNEKDLFFEAVTKAYITAKEEARRRAEMQ